MNKFAQQKQRTPARMGDSAGLYEDAEFPCFIHSKSSQTYSIFLDSVINGPSDMRYAINSFLFATPDDEIIVHLSSGGGSVDGGLSFLNAMAQSQAHVMMLGSGTIASMAAIILCDAESFQLQPHTSIMFHSVQFGMAAEACDVVAYSQFTKKQSEDMMTYYCLGVLTHEELDGIFNRKDVLWMNVEDFTNRFKRKMKAQDMLSDYVTQEGISTQSVTPALYVDLMKLMLKEIEAEEAEKPARKPRVKKAVAAKHCGNC